MRRLFADLHLEERVTKLYAIGLIQASLWRTLTSIPPKVILRRWLVDLLDLNMIFYSSFLYES